MAKPWCWKLIQTPYMPVEERVQPAAVWKPEVASLIFIQTCLGLLDGISSHPDVVMHMKWTADRLFGDQYHWLVLAAGRAQMTVAAMATSMGEHVRVGQEDSLWLGKGVNKVNF
jgi:uncharacterized protein (DUF849 family)